MYIFAQSQDNRFDGPNNAIFEKVANGDSYVPAVDAFLNSHNVNCVFLNFWLGIGDEHRDSYVMNNGLSNTIGNNGVFEFADYDWVARNDSIVTQVLNPLGLRYHVIFFVTAGDSNQVKQNVND